MASISFSEGPKVARQARHRLRCEHANAELDFLLNSPPRSESLNCACARSHATRRFLSLWHLYLHEHQLGLSEDPPVPNDSDSMITPHGYSDVLQTVKITTSLPWFQFVKRMKRMLEGGGGLSGIVVAFSKAKLMGFAY